MPKLWKDGKAKNYYFFECRYRIDYIKETDDDEYVTGYIEGYANDRKYKYFDENESRNAFFIKLIFNVNRFNKIKNIKNNQINYFLKILNKMS
jgi:hypothetical protein